MSYAITKLSWHIMPNISLIPGWNIVIALAMTGFMGGNLIICNERVHWKQLHKKVNRMSSIRISERGCFFPAIIGNYSQHLSHVTFTPFYIYTIISKKHWLTLAKKTNIAWNIRRLSFWSKNFEGKLLSAMINNHQPVRKSTASCRRGSWMIMRISSQWVGKPALESTATRPTTSSAASRKWILWSIYCFHPAPVLSAKEWTRSSG